MEFMEHVVLTTSFHQEGKTWVAFCKELGTSTYGKSLNEAQERIAEAIELHLNTLEEVGEIERFFAKNKIEIKKTRVQKAVNISVPTDTESFVRPYIYNMKHLQLA
jgi:predicted RNase H-like HicB family nuclease